MAGGKIKYAEGEFTLDSATATYNVAHNLGSTKILICAQRVNADHSNIDNATTRYQQILIFGVADNACKIDYTQTYSYSSGNQVHFLETGNVSNTYPGATLGYFPATDGVSPFPGVQTYPDNKLVAVDANTTMLQGAYQLCAGRWVWYAWALD